MMKKGDFDVLEIILGVPKTGKSTYAINRALAIQKETPCYIIAHDPGWRLPDHPAIMRHDSFASGAQGLKSRPGAIHSMTISDGQKVVDWALSCAKHSLGPERKKGVPVLMMIDDATQVRGVNRMRISDEMLDALVGRRHHFVGFIVTVQDPQFVHYSLISQSVRLTIFRMIDAKAIERLSRFGVPPELQAKVPNLPNFHYLTHQTS